jgi:hypothetical protein
VRRYDDLPHAEEALSKALNFLKNKAQLSADTKATISKYGKLFSRMAKLTDKAVVACGYRSVRRQPH